MCAKIQSISSNWKKLHHAARQWVISHSLLNKGLHQGKKVEGFRLSMSVTLNLTSLSVHVMLIIILHHGYGVFFFLLQSF